MKGYDETLRRMKEIHEAKSHDYSGDEDAFRNFRLCEELGLCPVELGILVRMTDKLSRVTNLMNTEARVNDEKVTDTLIDLANYSIILKCYLESKEGRK
jgi:hypothetical protein